MKTGIIIIICLAAGVFFFFYFRHLDAKAEKKTKAESKPEEKSTSELYEELQKTVNHLERPPLRKDPKVEALQKASAQSLRLNLAAEQAFLQMCAVANANRIYAAPKRTAQDEPWYRRAE